MNKALATAKNVTFDGVDVKVNGFFTSEWTPTNIDRGMHKARVVIVDGHLLKDNLSEGTAPGSASDGVAAALEAIRQEDLHKIAEKITVPTGGAYSPDELIALADPGPAEPSKQVEPAASPAPALLVTGVVELDHTSANVESDRQRAYAIIAEIDAELKTLPGKGEQLAAVIAATQATLDKADIEMAELTKRENELQRTRAEAADRAISLGQILLDTEAARLRRGL